MWHHAEGEGPSWELPETPAGITSGLWRRVGHFEKRIRVHFQDVAENVADSTHLDQVHRASPFMCVNDYVKGGGNTWKGRWLQQQYAASWSSDGTVSTTLLRFTIQILGRRVGFMSLEGRVRVLGPSFFDIHAEAGGWKFYGVMAMTPKHSFTVDIVDIMYTEPSCPSFVGKAVVRGLSNNVSCKRVYFLV